MLVMQEDRKLRSYGVHLETSPPPETDDFAVEIEPRVDDTRHHRRAYRKGASSAGTIILPIGQIASPASFRCAHAKGMPMIAGKKNGRDEMAERQPPPGKDEPHEVAKN